MTYRGDDDESVRNRLDRLEDELRRERAQREKTDAELAHLRGAAERARSLDPSSEPTTAAPSVTAVAPDPGLTLGQIMLGLGLVALFFVFMPAALLAVDGPVAIPALGRTVAPIVCPTGYATSTVAVWAIQGSGGARSEWVLTCAMPNGDTVAPEAQTAKLALGVASGVTIAAALAMSLEMLRRGSRAARGL